MNACRWPFLLVVALSFPLVWAGCSGSASSESSAGNGGQGPAQDPLAGAPDDWNAFLQWAEQRLCLQPQPVPIPERPNLAEPRWALVRLDDPATVRRARKSCDWTAPPSGQAALAELGPFRSDQRGPTFDVKTAPRMTPDGKDALGMVIWGFDVRCEDVGSIELTVSVPFGEHVCLNWSKAGVLLVPVESHDKPFTVRVLTDGFAEWHGPLQRISISTDGIGEGVFTVHALRFLPRKDSYPAPVEVKRVRLGHEIRTAIYAHCPAEITFENVLLPSGAKLHAGIGHVSGTGTGPAGSTRASETSFEVVVTHDGQQQTVLAQTTDTSEVWTDVSASLARWSGQEVTLTLKCTSTTPDTVAFWGNPIVYEPLDDPPLVIVYLIDTVASEHVDLYGFSRETMPRLAAMAANGVWFSRMFPNSSRTIESIPDLMLSLPAERHGVHHNSTLAPEGLVTIADALRAVGFATVSFCTNVNAGPRQGMDQGFDTFVDKIGYYWTSTDRTIPLEEVMMWIGQQRDRPMFLYIHTAEPHAPYTPPEGFAGHFDPDYRGEIDGSYDRATTFRNIRNPRTQQRDLQHVMALYDEEILYSDARLGLFLDALQGQNLLGKAHFFVTSDHGEEFLQHGHWEHGLNLHNEQTRVPLVAFGPSFKQGVRVDVPVQIVDVMPTILELLDLPVPYPLEGRSLLSFLRATGSRAEDAGNAQPAPRLADEFRKRNIYASNHNYRITRNLIEYSVIEDGRWKLIYGSREFPLYAGGPSSRFVLFDLASDEFERHNVIQNHQDVARRVMKDLLQWRLSQHPYDAGKLAPTEIDAAQMADLQALGYVGNGAADDLDEPNEPNKPD